MLENLDDFVTTYVVDPSGQDGIPRPGRIGPAILRHV
jgi:hypothetical protein